MLTLGYFRGGGRSTDRRLFLVLRKPSTYIVEGSCMKPAKFEAGFFNGFRPGYNTLGGMSSGLV